MHKPCGQPWGRGSQYVDSHGEGGVSEILFSKTVHEGGRGVKKVQKMVHVVCVRPQVINIAKTFEKKTCTIHKNHRYIWLDR